MNKIWQKNIQNFLEIATYLSPGGYSQDVAWWCAEDGEGSLPPHQICVCCFIQSHVKPRTAAPHGALTDDMAL